MPEPTSLYEQLFEHSPDGVLLTRSDGTVLRANPAACRALGRSEEEVRRVGRDQLMVLDDALRALLARRDTSRAAAGELTFRRPDGSTFPAEVTSGLLPSTEGWPLGYVIFRDLTERRRMEEGLRRTNRALRLVTVCNEALVRATSEAELFADICRLMVEVGGYRMCWVGLAEQDERKTVRPVAHAGHEDGYLATADIVWSDTPRGRGPTGLSIRTGRPIIAQNFATDDALKPWQVEARRRGYRSSTALPLVHEGERFGVITTYAGEAEVFDDDELEILSQLSNDLAYGIHALRLRDARAAAESALREREHLLTMSQRAAKLGTWSWRINEQLLQWSDETYRVYGLSPDMGPPDLELYFQMVHPEDRLVMRAWGEACAAGRQPTPVLFRAVRPDGSIRFVETAGDVIETVGGVPSRIAGTAHDVTERRLAESERERLATALEQAAEQVVITDAQGTILYVNPAFEAVTGYTRADAVGQNPRILKSGVQDPALYRELWETIRGGKTWHGRLVNKRKSGERYTEDLTISPVKDADDVVTSYVAVKRDITREIALEAQFLQSQKMEGIGRLAGGIAHDFNNILSVILAYTEFGLGGLREGDPLREDLLEIERAGNRAALLTRQLLAFSRKQVLQPEPLDLNQAIAEMEKMLRRILGEDIELVHVRAPDLGVVRADPGQVEQVIMNLAVNARDAMPDGGKLTIETANVELDAEYTAQHVGARPGPHVMIAVSDSGIGMDQATVAQVFEPFFTTKPAGKGTGLGLSTVYGIVKQSGGSIYVYSEPGRGTTFKIYLPQETSLQPVAKELTAVTRSAGTETILVVEDDAAVRTVAKRILAGAGYTVLTAANGGEGLLLCEQHPEELHLVLTDVVMPLMGGRVFAERLAKVRPTIKVLYMSGYTDDAIVHHGVLDAGLRFIGKPLTQNALLRKVREALDE